MDKKLVTLPVKCGARTLSSKVGWGWQKCPVKEGRDHWGRGNSTRRSFKSTEFPQLVGFGKENSNPSVVCGRSSVMRHHASRLSSVIPSASLATTTCYIMTERSSISFSRRVSNLRNISNYLAKVANKCIQSRSHRIQVIWMLQPEILVIPMSASTHTCAQSHLKWIEEVEEPSQDVKERQERNYNNQV